MLDTADSYPRNHTPELKVDKVWPIGAFKIIYQRPHKDENTHLIYAALDNMAYVLNRATGGQLSDMNNRLACNLAESHARSFRLDMSSATHGHPDAPLGFTFTLTPKSFVLR